MINIQTYYINPDKPETLRTQITADAESTEHIKTLVQRAMNTWPDAPAELKEFADLLLDGKILQDYKSQG